MKKVLDLGWGESVAVRKAFLETCKDPSVLFDNKSLENLGYPDHSGNPKLIELTREIIKRQIGKEYNHVLITNGATGGVTIALRTFNQKGLNYCWVRKPPYFRLYPGMADSAGLQIVSDHNPNYYNCVVLIDSPSNPEGIFHKSDAKWIAPVIWDSVYYSNVYCPGNHLKPVHDVLTGSYSKFTGLNGLRVGWIATNDSLLYERLKINVTSEYCGISEASTKIILDTAGKFKEKDWETFEAKATWSLDANRSAFSQLEKYFGNQPVTPYGMFYYAPVDKQCKKLLEKSNIIWSHGSSLHHTDDFGRFNIGQSEEIIVKAVREILKNDKRK